MVNKFNFLIAFLLMFSSQLVFSQSEITITGTRGPAGGGVGLAPPGSVYDRTEEQAKKAAAEAAAKAEKESRDRARLSCRTNNLAIRMACMNDARALYEKASARCDAYTLNALFYGGIATTGVAVIPAVIVGGGFTVAALNCASDAEGARDRHLQACQDTFDSFELRVCSSI